MAIHLVNAAEGAKHEIRPDPATVVSSTGEPTSVIAAPPRAYPLAAVCAYAGCRAPIRLASWSYLARWAHGTDDELAAAAVALDAIRSGRWDAYLGGLAGAINARKRTLREPPP